MYSTTDDSLRVMELSPTRSFVPEGECPARTRDLLDESTQPAAGSIRSLPQWIGKYKIVSILGRGGQATAYLAIDPDLHRQVVIKYYHSATTAQEQQAVLSEGRALAQVRSPFVAQCYGAEREGEIPYLIVEYIPGVTLSEYRRQHSLPPRRSLELIAQTAEGLRAIHNCGLLHRDLKPSNLIVGEDGQPRIVDFGLATSIGSEALRLVSGTPAYMAPEQARGSTELIGCHTDLFGLGAVLLELLSGEPPYPAGTLESTWRLARRGQLTITARQLPGVSSEVVDLCRRCLATEPSERFSSCAEFLQALRNVAELRPKGFRFCLSILGWQIRLVIAATAVAIVGIALGLPWSETGRNSTLVQAPALTALELRTDPVRTDLDRHLQEFPASPVLDRKDNARMSMKSEIGAATFRSEFEIGLAATSPISATGNAPLQIEIVPSESCHLRVWRVTATGEHDCFERLPVGQGLALETDSRQRLTLELDGLNPTSEPRSTPSTWLYFFAIAAGSDESSSGLDLPRAVDEFFPETVELPGGPPAEAELRFRNWRAVGLEQLLRHFGDRKVAERWMDTRELTP